MTVGFRETGGGLGDEETWRLGDLGTGRLGGEEAWGRGDLGTGRLGDWDADETDSLIRSAGVGGFFRNT